MSPSLHGHQARTWYTYIQSGQYNIQTIFLKTESFVLQKLREGVGYQMPGHTRLGVTGKAGLQEPDAGRWGKILFDYSITKKQKTAWETNRIFP